MAVLPWAPNRDQTGAAERRPNTALDWLSQSTAEPSRRALAGLIREHTRTVSGGAGSLGSRSRPNTSCSQRSPARNDEAAAAASSSSSSRLSTISSLEPGERPGKSFFLRSNGLKRRSSNMSLRSEAGSPPTMSGAGRFMSSRLGFRRKESSLDLSEAATPTISKPFGFQHLTHTEPKHVNGLSTIDEAELSARFHSMQSSPTGETELRGIPTMPIGSVTAPVKYATQPRVPSPVTTRTAALPTTPPPPTPPAKDSPGPRPTPPRAEVRVSRSMENFSRPTARSPTPGSPDRFIPTSLAHAAQALSRQTAEPPGDQPRSPGAIHALSTRDNTARRLMNAPLPDLPPTPTREEGRRTSHKRRSSSQGSLRHMSTFPSSRQAPAVGEGQLVGIEEETEHATRPAADDPFASPRQAAPCTPPRSRMLLDDWDVAIEDAWDQDEMTVGDRPPVAPPLPSLPTTPEPPVPSPRSRQGGRDPGDAPTSVEREHQLDTLSQLVGLGIASPPPASPARRATLPPLAVTVPPLGDAPAPWARTCHSALSTSSSQDSIILSIASSIRGTQRSSNSSVGPGDVDTGSATTCGSSPAVGCDPPKATRPESTCVPAALLQGFRPSSPRAPAAEHTDPARDAVAPLPGSEPPPERTLAGCRVPVPQRTSSIHRPPGHRRSSTSSSARRHKAHASYSLFPPTTPPSASR